jgi:mannose-6-phosphate isomerase
MSSEDAPRTVPEGRLGTPEELVGSEHREPPTSVGVPRRVEKPWGYELIWAETDHYVGKLLFVKAGEALSLQFHEEKDETLFLFRGTLELELGAGVHSLEAVELREGQSVRVLPGILHRMVAITDCTLFEASTPELDDVVRLSDRYGRAASDQGEPGG